MKKITRAYVTHFNIINMEQILPSGRKVCVQWNRTKNNKWMPVYSTDSVYHICPYDGQFIDCNRCECYNDLPDEMLKACEAKLEYISNEEMASRATACANAHCCTISFRSTDE